MWNDNYALLHVLCNLGKLLSQYRSMNIDRFVLLLSPQLSMTSEYQNILFKYIQHFIPLIRINIYSFSLSNP